MILSYLVEELTIGIRLVLSTRLEVRKPIFLEVVEI